MRRWSIHIDLFKQRKADPIVDLTGLFHRFIGFRFLPAELVTGKTKNDKTLVLIFLIQRLQSFKLRSKPAFSSSVDDEKGLAVVIGQVHRQPLGIAGDKLIEFA